MVLALAALSPRYLGGVLGRISLPGGADEQSLWRFRSGFPVADLLSVSGFNPAGLRGHAETLLAQAHSRDPLVKWLPLVRHTSYSGWSKLKGDPLDSMWKRVAAELLLQAHDRLCAKLRQRGTSRPRTSLHSDGRQLGGIRVKIAERDARSKDWDSGGSPAQSHRRATPIGTKGIILRFTGSSPTR